MSDGGREGIEGRFLLSTRKRREREREERHRRRSVAKKVMTAQQGKDTKREESMRIFLIPTLFAMRESIWIGMNGQERSKTFQKERE